MHRNRKPNVNAKGEGQGGTQPKSLILPCSQFCRAAATASLSTRTRPSFFCQRSFQTMWGAHLAVLLTSPLLLPLSGRTSRPRHRDRCGQARCMGCVQVSVAYAPRGHRAHCFCAITASRDAEERREKSLAFAKATSCLPCHASLLFSIRFWFLGIDSSPGHIYLALTRPQSWLAYVHFQSLLPSPRSSLLPR